MKKNTKEIDELLEIIGPVKNEKAKKFINKNMNWFYFWIAIMLIAGPTGIILMVADMLSGFNFPGASWVVVAMWGFIGAVLLAYIHLVIIVIEYVRNIKSNCHPDKGLDQYSFILQRRREKRIKIEGMYTMGGIALANLGRMNDLCKVIKLMDINCKSLSSLVYREYFRVCVADYYSDEEAVYDCAKVAGKLKGKLAKNKSLSRICDGIIECADNLNIKKNNKEQLYEKTLAKLSKAKGALFNVACYHELYFLAKDLGYEDKAEEYKKFVLENGGTTWLKRSLEDGFIKEEKPEDYPLPSISDDVIDKAKITNPMLRIYILFVLILILIAEILFLR